MKQRLKRLARRVRDSLPFASSSSLKARVEQLERDLDEQRRYGLRVAEMLDLLEAKLMPGSTSAAAPQNEAETETADKADEK